VVGLAAAELGMREADTEAGAMIEEDMIGVLLVVDTVVATEVDREATHRTRCCVGEWLIVLVMRLSRIFKEGRMSTMTQSP